MGIFTEYAQKENLWLALPTNDRTNFCASMFASNSDSSVTNASLLKTATGCPLGKNFRTLVSELAKD